MPQQFEAHVPPELADLVPEFLRNRQKQLEELRRAVQAQDFQQLREQANSMIGVGKPYGFPEVSALGKRIDSSARERDAATAADLVELYGYYLEHVRVNLPDPGEPADLKPAMA
jgi:HPt (histidine-containing phosphotransfer) domain-containing protein